MRRERRKNGKDTGAIDVGCLVLQRMSALPGKNFTEGWVEFEDKRVAKRVAAQLNGQPMGGKKRGAYFYDLW